MYLMMSLEADRVLFLTLLQADPYLNIHQFSKEIQKRGVSIHTVVSVL